MSNHHDSHLWSSNLLHRAIENAHENDPYANYRFWKDNPAERAILYRYQPALQYGSGGDKVKLWETSEHLIRMETSAFARGSMRTCFRLKKLSEFLDHPSWENASCYVAKYYTHAIEVNHDQDPDHSLNRQMVTNDIRLQMTSKYFAEIFNRFSPPKKVDVMQVMMMELPDRPGKPCYCLERYLGGKYVKYNSNVGFTDHHRNTPQAYSHFTFERSGGRLIIVDIQGVGDLYTDPQIHSINPESDEFGEGNLGLSGYAYFFHTHQCNSICRLLDLEPFEHYPYIKTLSRLEKQQLAEESEELDKKSSTKTLWKRQRRFLTENLELDCSSPPESRITESPKIAPPKHKSFDKEKRLGEMSQILSDLISNISKNDKWLPILKKTKSLIDPILGSLKPHQSVSNEFESKIPARKFYDKDINMRNTKSILGKIHRQIAIQFLNDKIPFSIPASSMEIPSIVLFHYRKAADFGCMEAQLALSNFYLDQPSNELDLNNLSNLSSRFIGQLEERNVDQSKREFSFPKDMILGVEYAEQAAQEGSRVGLLKVAFAYDTINTNFSPFHWDSTENEDHTRLYSRLPYWNTRYIHAYNCYLKAVNEITEWTQEDVNSQSFELNISEENIYVCLARLVEHGGCGLSASSSEILDPFPSNLSNVDIPNVKNLQKSETNELSRLQLARKYWENAAECAEIEMKAKRAIKWYEEVSRLSELIGDL